MLPSQTNGALGHPGRTPDNKLAGSWSFVSSVDTRNDGTLVDRWGPNTRGMLMFDDNDYFAQIIIGSVSRMFGSKTYCAFGKYTFDADAGNLNLKFKGCTIAKAVGSVEERKIVLLTADELKYVNPLTASGTVAEVVWKRLV
ncbi:MAG: lipocalin-like domain-containing protein [Xanthobacteraceae bacterium]|nr:lipocalin-like domain-containing protein [Xanthobacteraceae bacterium]